MTLKSLLFGFTRNKPLLTILFRPTAITLSVFSVFIICIWAFNFIRLSLVLNNGTNRLAYAADATIGTVADVADTTVSHSTLRYLWNLYKDYLNEKEYDITVTEKLPESYFSIVGSWILSPLESSNHYSSFVGYLIASVVSLSFGYFVQEYLKPAESKQHRHRCTCAPGLCRNCVCSKSSRTCSQRCNCKADCDNTRRASESLIKSLQENTIGSDGFAEHVFNLSTKQKSAQIVLFIGVPECGKSFAIRSILLQMQKSHFFNFGIAMTGTAFTGQFNYIGKENIWEGFDIDRLENYIKFLRAVRDRNGQIPPNFVIVDDLQSLFKKYDSFVDNWLSTFRHTNTWIFYSAQTLTRGTSTSLRQCANLILMFRNSAIDEVKNAYKYWGNDLDLKIFEQSLKAATKRRHSCLLISPRVEMLSDKFLTFKASDINSSDETYFPNTIDEVDQYRKNSLMSQSGNRDNDDNADEEREEFQSPKNGSSRSRSRSQSKKKKRKGTLISRLRKKNQFFDIEAKEDN